MFSISSGKKWAFTGCHCIVRFIDQNGFVEAAERVRAPYSIILEPESSNYAECDLSTYMILKRKRNLNKANNEKQIRSYPLLIWCASHFLFAQRKERGPAHLLAGGESHSLLIDNGKLLASGASTYEQLGSPDFRTSLTFQQVGQDTDWKCLEASDRSSYAIKSNGTLWAWGFNRKGQLGDSTTTIRSLPVQVGQDSTWVTVSSMMEHVLAIKADGTLWAWGDNPGYQLGNGNNTNQLIPVQVGTDNDWVQATAGNGFSRALKADGSIWSWGFNNWGQLGNGTNTIAQTPTRIGSDNDWVYISNGQIHTLAIKADGSLWAWGNNSSGQLGDGSTTNSNVPIRIGSDNDWVQAHGGFYHSAALKSDGSVWVWGSNQFGQLGQNSSGDNFLTSPTRVGTDNDWTQVYCGNYYVMALKANGIYYGWGRNNSTLGTGDFSENTLIPKKSYSSEIYFTRLSLGYAHSLAIRSDGSLWGWGSNAANVIGQSSEIEFSAVPLQVGSDNNWKEVSAGQNFSFALKADGTLWAWGYNYHGQLGNNSTDDLSIPTQIGMDNDWIKIFAGIDYCIALKSNGTLWSWGRNHYGQLGHGTDVSSTVPVQIGTDSDWVQASPGTHYAMAQKADGSLYTWGRNNFSQLGDGTTNDRSNPTRLGTDDDWLIAKANAVAAVAIKADGTLWTWGGDTNGELGNGNASSNVSSPAQIAQQDKWKSIHTKGAVVFALRSDNTLWGCGVNYSGELGLGHDGDSYHSLVLSDGSQTISLVSAGGNHTIVTHLGSSEFCGTGFNSMGTLGNGSTTNVSTFDCVCLTAAPSGSQNPTLCSGATLSDITLNESSFVWYDQAEGGTSYAPNTLLENSKTYYASQMDGCESRARLAVTAKISPSYNVIDVQMACGSYTWIDGITYMESNNTATHMLTSVDGCDSLVSLDLTIHQPSSSTHTLSACGSYTWIDGNTYTASNNSATHVLTSSVGCDSTITLNLTILQNSTGVFTVSSCDTYTWIDGSTFTESNNTATITLTNHLGCDSVVTLDLTINKANTGVSRVEDKLVADFESGVYQWLDCNNVYKPISGATSREFTPLQSGLYALQIVDENCFGVSECYDFESTVTSSSVDLLNEIKIYPNPATDMIFIQLPFDLGEFSISVISASGAVVYQVEFIRKDDITLSIDHYLPGVYRILIMGNNGYLSTSIIKE
ncbi:MAG: T9SS type A sorting domain-containing protein [Cytophagales bacterium]|nr:T9SS type A sorting domain-containing protein [Cytophagales bacterium]